MADLALAVLVDGVKAEEDTVIKKGQKVVILPKIAGGASEKKVFNDFMEGWEHVRDVACGPGLQNKLVRATIEFTGFEDEIRWTVNVVTE
jgi:hypothetical protein